MAAKKISQREARQLRARVRRLENQLDLMGNRYRDLPGIHVADVEGSSAVVEILTPGAERDLLAQALSRGTVHAYAPIVPPLSEIYREVTA